MKDKERLNIIESNEHLKLIMDSVKDCPYRQSLIFDALFQVEQLVKLHTQQDSSAPPREE